MPEAEDTHLLGATGRSAAPRRALVTGGAGFLGSHLCDRLLSEQCEVICLDNVLTGRTENISHLVDKLGFTFTQQDVTTPVVIDGPLDYVLHFASPASPKDYARHPIHTLKVGALGTHNALGLAKAKGAVFLLASSSEVYGDAQVNPQSESYWGNVNPIGPRSVYDEAKRFAEAITLAYHREHGLDTRIARIFNCYGPRMRLDDGRAVPTFIRQALRNEPLTVYGDGSQTRSFCYVDDMVDGVFRLLVLPSPISGDGADLIVNLGNPKEETVLELAAKTITLANSKSEVTFEPLPDDDPKMRRPNISRARSTLGWSPKVSVEDGLLQTISHFGQQLGMAARRE